MPPILLRSDQGRTISVDEGDAQYWINQGFRPSSVHEAQADIKAPERDQGLAGTVRAGVESALSGATLGLSDVVLGSLASDNEREAMLAARRQNPTLSTAAEFAGNLAPGLLSGGASAAGRVAALTPAGAVSRVGAGLAEAGAEAGLLGKAAAMGAGGAVEGAAALGGSYLAQTALENKPLSAEAFVGAMGGGALFGGGVGGALGVGGHVLSRARSLFPKNEITREAAQAVERDAVTAVRGALDDGRAMQDAVSRELEAMKLQVAEERLAAGAPPDPTLVDQVAPGRLNWALDRAAQPSRRGRRVFESPEEPLAPPPEIPAPLSGTVEAPLPFEVRRAPPPPPAAGARAHQGSEPILPSAAQGTPPAPGDLAERAIIDLSPQSPRALPEPEPVSFRPPGVGDEGLAQRAVFDFGPEAPPVRQAAAPSPPLERTVQVGRSPVAAAPEAAEAAGATAVGRRGARGGVPDEILAPPGAVSGGSDIDAALRRVAQRGGFDLAPALEPVAPRGPTTRAAAGGGSLEDQLQEMARQAEAGVPLREMRSPAAAVPAAAVPDDVIASRAARPAPGIPDHHALSAQLDALGEDYLEQVVPARQIADRGYYEPPGGHSDPVRAENARAAIRDGQREAIKLGVSEEGKIVVMDGRHRLAAAIEADAPIRVKWTTAFEPAEHDVFRGGRSSVAGVDDAVKAAAVPLAPVAELAEAALTRANPKAAKILDAARKEAATRAEVERMFNQQAGPSVETAAGRRPPPAEAQRPGSGTVPWRELEAMKLRGEAPAPVLPGSKAQPIPDFFAIADKNTAEGVLQVASTEEIAKRGWFDARSVRARKAFKEDIWGTPGDANISEARREAGRKIAENVRARPSIFEIDVTPDGHLVLSSVHKPEVFAAMLERGGDIQVRWRPWTEWMNEGAPKAADVFRAFDSRLSKADFERWDAARARGFTGSLRDFMDAAGGGRRVGLGSAVADEVRLAAGGERPQGSAWIPLLTPEGEVIGRAPILEEALPGTVAGRKGLAAGSDRQALADQILKGASGSAPPPIDDQIATALGKRVGHMVPMGEDIAEAAKKINAHEEALADLAEALGEAAPPAAVSRAAQFRAAQAAHADAVAGAQAHAAQQIEDNLHTVVEAVNSARVNAALDKEAARAAMAAEAGAGGAGRQLGAAADIGAGLEVLKAMGIAVPDVERIPVIGPVLGMYLKARAALGIWKRAGGAVPQSLEGLIASKGAKTKDRVAAAMGKMLELGERGAQKARPAAGAIGALGYRLFPGSEEPATRRRARDAEDPVARYHARMDELARAAQPGAIERAVAERIPTADPALRDAVTVAIRRKLNYIDSQAPRPPLVPALFQPDAGWRPSAQKLESFARTIAAAEDPAGVLEDVAAGRGVSIEAANTLRNVYPGLFAQAQGALAQAAPKLQGRLPYARAVSMRVLFDVPTDPTTTPEHVRFLQQGSPAPGQDPAAGATSPAAPSAPASPPTPSIAGPVSAGDRTMTRLDQRAGR